MFPVPKRARTHRTSSAWEIGGGKMVNVTPELLPAGQGRATKIYEGRSLRKNGAIPHWLEYAGRDLFKVRNFSPDRTRGAASQSNFLQANYCVRTAGTVTYSYPLSTGRKFSRAQPIKRP